MKGRDTDADTAQRQPAVAPNMQESVQARRGVPTAQNGALQAALDHSPRMLAQRRTIEAAFGPATQPDVHSSPNKTGMPNQLKAGIESLTGMDVSDVRVHRNSDKPAQLNALAYAQGDDIHLGPGQEQHLPHEAWHVVQQRQGRVHATAQMAGVGVNDDEGLEREADLMGGKALMGGNAVLQGAKSPTPVQLRSVRQFVGERWYEHTGGEEDDDCTHLKGRWVGLPGFTGWLEMKSPHPKYPTYKVYMSIDTFSKWNKPNKFNEVIDPTGIFAAAQAQIQPVISEVKSETTRLVQPVLDVYEEIGGPEPTRENLQVLQQRVVTFEQAFDAYLKSSWTPVKLVLGLLGAGVLVGGGMLLALISLPWWLVLAVEGLSFLYGVYLMYRWTKSNLLPTTIKTVLLLLNGLAMGALVAFTFYDVVGYYAGLLEAAPFEHIRFAAIPFALVLEYAIVRLLERLEAMRDAAAKRSPTAQTGESAV